MANLCGTLLSKFLVPLQTLLGKHGTRSDTWSTLRPVAPFRRLLYRFCQWAECGTGETFVWPWQKHFASVFAGVIVECPGETAGAGRDAGVVSSVNETFWAIRALKNWKKASDLTPSMLKSSKLVGGPWQFCRIVYKTKLVKSGV